jgi:pyruvate dehydrogenase E2 component (dihydrolipoamide acetyltransferase)
MSELEFRLPDVGEGLSEAEIVEWHVEPGSAVKRDQVLVDVETDKSLVELPSPVNGTVVRLGGDAGDVLEVGAVLVVLETDEPVRASSREPGDGAASASLAPPTPAAPAAAATPVEEAPEAPADAPDAPEDTRAAVDGAAPPGRRVLASPATRKLALELGVDLSAVWGSGPGGRISKDDVTSFAQEPQAPAPSAEPRSGAPMAVDEQPRPGPRRLVDEVVPLRGLRRQIAKSMTRSWRDVPHITDFREVDATGLVAARARLRPRLEREGVAFTYLPLLVKAVVASLGGAPEAQRERRHGRGDDQLPRQAEHRSRHHDRRGTDRPGP